MYETEVNRGINFLDEMVNQGHLSQLWFHSIDLERLDLKSARNCVLGQLFDHIVGTTRPGRPHPWFSGFHYVASEFMDYDWEYIEDRGFDARYSGPDTGRNYDALKAAWTSKILDMREAFPRD